jgi:Ycf66 protein N-terminus
MVNFGLNSASVLGIFLAVAGASLYFLRTVRPEVSRDHDIFFAAVGLLCGFILLFQGWRLDPILQFGQFLLTGSTIFFAVESIRLRQVATEQARRNTPTVDRDRPVSRTRVYREEEYESDRDRIIPDAYNVYDGATPNYDSPRLRGYEEPQPRSSRNRNLRDEEPRTRSSRNREDRYDNLDSPRSRNARNTPSRQDNYRDSWEETDYPQTNRPSSKRDINSRDTKRERSFESRNEANEPYSYDPYNTQNEPRASTRRPKSNPVDRDRGYRNDNLGRNYDDNLGTRYEDDLGSSYEEDKEDVIATDYVDYQPMNDTDDDYDDYGERGRNEE